MRIASYILNRFQKTGDLSSQTVWITVEAVKRPASWMSSKSERTEHLRRSFEVVKGRHAAGGEAMRRSEQSEAEKLFSSDRFRQSHDDRRAIIFPFCESCKIAIANSLKTKNRKSPENDSRE
jgi:peptide subunit release factor 1 (eRF1)